MCVQVRYGQLGKQQERLLRDMEAVVARRETMVMRSEAQARSQRKQPTHADLHGMLQSLRRKILDTQKVCVGGGGGGGGGVRKWGDKWESVLMTVAK